MIALRIQKKLDGPNGDMLLDLDIQIQKGQFVTLYGASGAGKTSTLRILSGLLQAEKGKIEVNGTTWFDSATKVNKKPQTRNIGYVFQDYALFPTMTVEENLLFGLPKKGDQKEVTTLLEMMELVDLKDRKPTTLSGGQKQRVALARALVQKPAVLLLDEPLSALDMKIRLKLQDYLLKVHKTYELTTILISHDIGEIYRLSNQVFVLENGKVIKSGTPSEVFLNDTISGKFKFKGEVLKIEKDEVVYLVTVLIQNEVVKVIAAASEIKRLTIGDRVIVASKAFNPVIYKIE